MELILIIFKQQPLPESEITPVVAKPVKTANRKSRSIKNLTKHIPATIATTSNGTISTLSTSNETPKVGLKSDTTAKRNSMSLYIFLNKEYFR